MLLQTMLTGLGEVANLASEEEERARLRTILRGCKPRLLGLEKADFSVRFS